MELDPYSETENKLRRTRKLGVSQNGGIKKVESTQLYCLSPPSPQGELAKLDPEKRGRVK